MRAKSERTFSTYPLCLSLVFLLSFLAPACAKEDPNTPEPVRNWLRDRRGLMDEASRMDPESFMYQMDCGPDANHKLAVFYTIREMGPTDGLKPLGIDSPFDECSNHRMYYWSIVRYWGAQAVPGLTAMMGSEPSEPSGNPAPGNPRIACELLSALGGDASDAATPLTMDLYKEFYVDEDVFSPIDALAYIGVRIDQIIDYGISVLDSPRFSEYSGDYRKTSVCYMLGRIADPSDQRVIDKIKEYLDLTLQPTLPHFQGFSYKDSDAARAALYMLGVDQEEMLRALVENGDGYALIRIGDERAIEALREVLSTPVVDPLKGSMYFPLEELCLLGPRDDVIEIIVDQLKNWETSPNYELLDLISSFGPDAIDTLPYLLEWYNKMKAEEPGLTDSTNRYRLLPLETAIVRVSEGTYWQIED